jgi:hypothetical protein
MATRELSAASLGSREQHVCVRSVRRMTNAKSHCSTQYS